MTTHLKPRRQRMRQQALPLANMRDTPTSCRIAAATALINPYLTPQQRQANHDYYIQQAEQIEAQLNDRR